MQPSTARNPSAYSARIQRVSQLSSLAQFSSNCPFRSPFQTGLRPSFSGRRPSLLLTLRTRKLPPNCSRTVSASSYFKTNCTTSIGPKHAVLIATPLSNLHFPHVWAARPDMDLNLPTSVVLISRLLAALTSSYIHPDEHFQGPQVIAALVFGWDAQKTWEFTTDRPIRSAASLWTVYAPVMYPWKFILGSNVSGFPLYFALRLWFVLLTYVFGTTHVFIQNRSSLTISSVDRSLPDIVGSAQRVQVTRFLLTSSYAFLVYQSHTFSNSIETILVVQTLVLCKTLSRWPNLRTPARFGLLGVLVAYGIFNRPTFPFWILVPIFSLLFHLSLRDV
jgi:hypothetical protein